MDQVQRTFSPASGCFWQGTWACYASRLAWKCVAPAVNGILEGKKLPTQTLPQIHEDQEQRTSLEPLYRVIIHNDDVTPMDFVLHILRSVFLLDGLRALQVMYTAHYHGSAYVQTLPKSEAVERVGRAHMAARLSHYPLQFTVEPEE